ncbi:hypothetical protein GWI33_018423 [Rhynchophorus ferrugineus]|uniref:Uncharacterized protein n=1 Tax=Rhynchophorus ferrugineus TaxID=354439 RepID=A0A834HXB2_RHYFE|nr:hypothetical protein GWI33_018423 [Rhynchophorus ferrugineus]
MGKVTYFEMKRDLKRPMIHLSVGGAFGTYFSALSNMFGCGSRSPPACYIGAQSQGQVNIGPKRQTPGHFAHNCSLQACYRPPSLILSPAASSAPALAARPLPIQTTRGSHTRVAAARLLVLAVAGHAHRAGSIIRLLPAFERSTAKANRLRCQLSSIHKPNRKFHCKLTYNYRHSSSLTKNHS